MSRVEINSVDCMKTPVPIPGFSAGLLSLNTSAPGYIVARFNLTRRSIILLHRPSTSFWHSPILHQRKRVAVRDGDSGPSMIVMPSLHA